MTNEELVKAIQDGVNVSGNLAALYEQCRRFLYQIALRNAWAGEVDDLVQEQYIALQDAALRYDPARDVKFLSFAAYYLTAAVFDYAVQNGRGLRLPAELRRKVYILRKVETQLTAEQGAAPTERELMDALGVSPDEFDRLRKLAEGERVLSFDAPIGEDPESATLGEMTAADEDPEEEVLDRIASEAASALLWDTVSTLPEEEAAIVRDVYRHGMTYAEAAEQQEIETAAARRVGAAAIRDLRHGTRRVQCERAADLMSFGFSSELAYSGSYASFSRSGSSSTERLALERIKRGL